MGNLLRMGHDVCVKEQIDEPAVVVDELLAFGIHLRNEGYDGGLEELTRFKTLQALDLSSAQASWYASSAIAVTIAARFCAWIAWCGSSRMHTSTARSAAAHRSAAASSTA